MQTTTQQSIRAAQIRTARRSLYREVVIEKLHHARNNGATTEQVEQMQSLFDRAADSILHGEHDAAWWISHEHDDIETELMTAARALAAK